MNNVYIGGRGEIVVEQPDKPLQHFSRDGDALQYAIWLSQDNGKQLQISPEASARFWNVLTSSAGLLYALREY